MKKVTLLFLVCGYVFAAEPKPTIFTFVLPKAVCTISDGKLVLAKMWPMGNWEECAYAILGAAQTLDNQKDTVLRELETAKKQLQEANATK